MLKYLCCLTMENSTIVFLCIFGRPSNPKGYTPDGIERGRRRRITTDNPG
jgi:hypothetical protein